MKTPVPGLYRGVQVWRRLCEADAASLDQLAVQTGYPKASVLRMLKTLCDLQLVERSDGGLYRAVARIASSEGAGRDFEQAVFQTLEKLSAELSVTAEWFEPDAQGLLLTQRCSPPEAEVHVKARSGFVREWGGELDAVAVLGYAFYTDVPSGRSKLLTYGPQGQPVILSAADARARIAAARRTRVVVDSCYNSNGVKRIAAAVLRQGELVGVLSLALAFTPSLDLKMEGLLKTLQQAADELEKQT
jgi:DNA-binding IclR family transcriptional regulator